MKTYDSYKDSGFQWYGAIPSNWNILPMKFLFDIYSGATPDTGKDEYWDGDINWITPADYKTEDYYVSGGRKKITENGYQSCGTSMLPVGSIVFSKRAPIGTVAITSSELCTNQGCLGCVPKNVNAKYYYYSMSVLKDQFELFGSGSTFKEISATDFSNFKMLVPPLKEQDVLVTYLDQKSLGIDSLIKQRLLQIHELVNYRKSIIAEVVTQGISSNLQKKNIDVKWLNDIPSNWNVFNLNHISSTTTGLTFTKADLVENGNAVISYGQIHSKLNPGTTLVDELIRYVPDRLIEGKESAKVNYGDFIFADTSEDLEGCGNCVLVDKEIDLYAGYHTTILRLKDKSNSKYLSYLFKTDAWRSQLRSRVNGVKLYSITQGILKQASVILPPIDEQKEITEYLDQKCEKISKLVDLLDKEIKELEKYKTAIISEAVTGKIKVF